MANWRWRIEGIKKRGFKKVKEGKDKTTWKRGGRGSGWRWMLNTEYMLYMVEVSLGFQCWLFIFCLRTWLLISYKNWSGELINFKYRIQLINLNWYIYIYILCIIKRAGRVVAGWQCFNPLSNPICV